MPDKSAGSVAWSLSTGALTVAKGTRILRLRYAICFLFEIRLYRPLPLVGERAGGGAIADGCLEN
jgi:hypothetical protein